VWVSAVALLAVVAWGVFGFREAIASAAGAPFEQLTAQEIRWAQLYGGVDLGGAAGIAMALAPILGALAILGAFMHRKWWLLLLVAALVLVTQSPSRTSTLSLTVSAATFALLVGRIRNVRWRPGRLGVLAVFFAASAFLYFMYVGGQLDKNDLAPGLVPAPWVVSGLEQPLVYGLGGLSAFSVAAESPSLGNPYGQPGRSVYILVRILSSVGIETPTPDPFASYVDIPIPFNVYTAFGDAYFDGGLAGVVIVFLATGVAVSYAWRRAAAGSVAAAWVASILVTVLVSTPLSLRVGNVDVWLQAVVGAVVIRLVTWERKRTRAKHVPLSAADGSTS
jgi:hypothetical protein